MNMLGEEDQDLPCRSLVIEQEKVVGNIFTFLFKKNI